MFVNLADCVDATDPNGRTYRQINSSKSHNIPIGSLVEVRDPEYPSDNDGIRLFAVHQGRDCDQTPLYWLSPDKSDTIPDKSGFANRKWVGGYSESSLTLIRLP